MGFFLHSYPHKKQMREKSGMKEEDNQGRVVMFVKHVSPLSHPQYKYLQKKQKHPMRLVHLIRHI